MSLSPMISRPAERRHAGPRRCTIRATGWTRAKAVWGDVIESGITA